MRAEMIMRWLGFLKPTKPPPEAVCICVPLVGSDGKLIPQPSPDCLIPEHSQLARDLIAAAQGKGQPGTGYKAAGIRFLCCTGFAAC